jgi:hypothetical protein
VRQRHVGAQSYQQVSDSARRCTQVAVAPALAGTAHPFERSGQMDAAQNLKIALDETRMLILGAQVLLGFQMRSVFQEAFEQLPASSKVYDAAALFLMVAAVGLLIAPAAHHRVVDGGDATRRIMRIIGLCMSGALLLFATALGINIFIGLERIAGFAAAIMARVGRRSNGACVLIWHRSALALGLAADVFVVIAKIAESCDRYGSRGSVTGRACGALARLALVPARTAQRCGWRIAGRVG